MQHVGKRIAEGDGGFTHVAIEEGKIRQYHIGVVGAAISTGGRAVDGHILCAPGQREGQTGGGGFHIDDHGHGHMASAVGRNGCPGVHLVGAAIGKNNGGQHQDA